MKKNTLLKQLKKLEKLGKPMLLAADNWQNPWQTLISIILSARTRDEVTIKVCNFMFKKYPNPQKFSKLNLSQIKKLIGSINFYNNKSKNILKASQIIVEKFKGKVPMKFDILVTLPGVGRKTANVFLTVYGGNHIGVDTHVRYISNYLGWVTTENPKKIEESLKKLFPQKKWNELNKILVTFGKTYTSKKEKDSLLNQIKVIT